MFIDVKFYICRLSVRKLEATLAQSTQSWLQLSSIWADIVSKNRYCLCIQQHSSAQFLQWLHQSGITEEYEGGGGHLNRCSLSLTLREVAPHQLLQPWQLHYHDTADTWSSWRGNVYDRGNLEREGWRYGGEKRPQKVADWLYLRKKHLNQGKIKTMKDKLCPKLFPRSLIHYSLYLVYHVVNYIGRFRTLRWKFLNIVMSMIFAWHKRCATH